MRLQNGRNWTGYRNQRSCLSDAACREIRSKTRRAKITGEDGVRGPILIFQPSLLSRNSFERHRSCSADQVLELIE